jgi:predicted transcriptional regulator
MYARLEGEDALQNRTRCTIHGIVVENPGIHFSAIVREMGLCNGEAEYHLTVLERQGYVRVRRAANLRRFYPVGMNVPEDNRPTASELRERIVELVQRSPGISQKELVERLCAGRSLVGYHVSCLLRAGLLRERQQGRFRVYTPARGRRAQWW